jgi:hypothetical protein
MVILHFGAALVSEDNPWGDYQLQNLDTEFGFLTSITLVLMKLRRLDA